MIKIAVIPNRFKDHLSGQEVGRAIKKGLYKELGNSAEIEIHLIADGGLGTAGILAGCFGAQSHSCLVPGPFMEPVRAKYFLNSSKKIGCLDMASAAGLHLVPLRKRNPRKTTTFGVGETIRILIKKGAEKIYIGLGDSATNDGGVGMAQALGYKFIDEKGHKLPQGRFDLRRIEEIRAPKEGKYLDPESNLKVIGLCDGNMTLIGPKGISLNTAEQKGANPKQSRELEKELFHLNQVFKDQFRKDFADTKKSGSAGGLAAGVAVFLAGELVWGVPRLIKALNLSELIARQDLIIVGEGKLDYKTSLGKSPYFIAEEAKKYGVPVVALVGTLSGGYEQILKHGVISILRTDPLLRPLEETKQKNLGKKEIAQKASELGRLLRNLSF